MSLALDKDRTCPRDGALLKTTTMGEATLDVCGRCEGTFFDSGEMLLAFGVSADPASWDRSETGGMTKESKLQCPRCHVGMHAQDVAHDGKQVEIDRCGKCRGVWLDKNEIDIIVAIGHAMQPRLAEERAKAQAELAKLGDEVTFTNPWKLRSIYIGLVVIVIAAATAIYIHQRPRLRPRAWEPSNADMKEGGTGCPCGCDHSAAMAVTLRRQRGAEASKQIEKSLDTIAAREDVGYITERMIQHRLRLLDLANELSEDAVAPPTAVAVDASTETLVEALAEAHTYQERQPIKRQLYGLGKNALPQLAILSAHHDTPAIRSSSSAMLQSIAMRAAREDHALIAEDKTLRVSSDLIVHGERVERVESVEKQDKLITPSFRLWLKIENLTDRPRSLKPPSVHATHDLHPTVTRWYEEDGDGRPWDGVVPPKGKMRINVIGDIPEHLKPGTEIEAAIDIDALTIIGTTKAIGVVHLIKP